MNTVQLKISRRWFIISATTSSILAGCGENRLAQTISDAYKLSLDQKGPPIARKTINNLPYAAISAKIGKGPRGLLILWRTENNAQLWLSVDNVIIITKNGRVVKTAGLPEQMVNTYHTNYDPVELGMHKTENLNNYVREVDFKETNGSPKTLKILSEFEIIGPKVINIVEIDFNTILIKETCNVQNINWKFENYYWVDPIDGIIWKSIQHIARSFPPITIETLKPPN